LIYNSKDRNKKSSVELETVLSQKRYSVLSKDYKSIDEYKSSNKINSGGKTPRDKDKLLKDVEEIYKQNTSNKDHIKPTTMYASNKF